VFALSYQEHRHHIRLLQRRKEEQAQLRAAPDVQLAYRALSRAVGGAGSASMCIRGACRWGLLHCSAAVPGWSPGEQAIIR